MLTPNVVYEYDKEGDVLYASFGTGEPSFCDNIDDIVIIEFGIYSGLPTGFRILDIKHHRIKNVSAVFSTIEPIMKEKEEEATQMRSEVFQALKSKFKDNPDLNSIMA